MSVKMKGFLQELPPAVIETPAQLQVFASSAAFGSRQRVILNIPGLADARAGGERLNRYRHECGCSAGAWAMTAAFVMVLIWLMMHYGPFNLATLKRMPIAIVGAILSAAVIKAVVIARSRSRARREVALILAKTADNP